MHRQVNHVTYNSNTYRYAPDCLDWNLYCTSSLWKVGLASAITTFLQDFRNLILALLRASFMKHAWDRIS